MNEWLLSVWDEIVAVSSIFLIFAFLEKAIKCLTYDV